MPTVELEPTIPTSERPQTHGLDSAATGVDNLTKYAIKSYILFGIHSYQRQQALLNADT
jgi:hypothetical protein